MVSFMGPPSLHMTAAMASSVASWSSVSGDGSPFWQEVHSQVNGSRIPNAETRSMKAEPFRASRERRTLAREGKSRMGR